MPFPLLLHREDNFFKRWKLSNSEWLSNRYAPDWKLAFNDITTAYKSQIISTTAAQESMNMFSSTAATYTVNVSFTVAGNFNEVLANAFAYKPATLTPEQLLAAKRKATIAKARITRAKNKARTLLLMHLDIRQTLDFEKYGYFFVLGSEGNLYQIRTGRSHNVRLMDPLLMKPIYTLCAHPTLAVPDCDTMLAQKLWIEHDEPAFIQIANRGIPYANEVAEVLTYNNFQWAV